MEVGTRGLLVVLVATATLVAGGARSSLLAAETAPRLTAGSDEIGWVSLALHGPVGGTVDVREQVGGRSLPVARLALPAGTGEIRHAGRWVCHRQLRRFSATFVDASGTTRPASATIATPTCAHRLRLIVTPARVRPGRTTNVRVSDSWRLGGVSARICATSPPASTSCKAVRLGAGATVKLLRVPLPRAGRWTITLRSATGQHDARHVVARSDAQPRILVTGDSMIYGIFETIGRDLGRGRSVLGDPHPATGITKPDLFDWPDHARRSPPADATVVFLGAADGGFALATPDGRSTPCCGPAWVAAYASIAGGMMASYLRSGTDLVYWTLLPTPRSPARAEVFRAINEAARIAARGFGDGVRLIGEIATTLAPGGRYSAAIVFKGRRRLVRAPDGVHLATPGIHIASAIIVRALRRDGLLR